MSSERYELAQDDLEVALEEIRDTVERATSQGGGRKKGTLNPEDKRQLVTRCRSQLNDAGSLLKDMEHEARIAPMQYRRDMLSKVRQFREEMTRIQQSLKPLAEPPPGLAAGGQASGGSVEDFVSPDEMRRQQVMAGREVLERTGASIARSHMVAVETEEIGGAIVDDLGVQRETLERSRARLQDTNAELSRGRRVLTRLKIATVYNKIILIAIIIIEILIIGALVYIKFIKR